MNFDKTAIDEANKHLQAMNKRVVEMGALLNEKTVRLENIEAENQAKIEAIIRQKDAEIEQRNAWLESTRAEIRRLNAEIARKDSELAGFISKANILDKAVRYKPELQALLNCLSEVEQTRLVRANSTDPSLKRTSVSRQSSTDEKNPGTQHAVPSKSNGTVQARESTNAAVNEMGSGEESSSDEDSYEIARSKGVIWTPKAKPISTHVNSQNTSENNSKSYNAPPRIPGGAVKDNNDNGDREEDSGTAQKQEPLAYVKNYETQL